MKKHQRRRTDKDVSGPSEPTPYELARLAVAMSHDASLERIAFGASHGRGNYSWHSDSQETALKGALALWLKADDLLQKWRASPTMVFPKPAQQPLSEPRPKRYPVKINEFMRLVLPKLKGRTGEQGDVFRRYLGYRLRNPSMPPRVWDMEHTPKNPKPFDCCDPQVVIAGCDALTGHAIVGRPIEPTKDAVDRYFGLWNSKGIPDRESFQYHKRWFRDWYDRMHPAESSAAKSNNARKKHARAKLRKHLWETSCKANPNSQVPWTQFPEVTDDQMDRLLKLNGHKPLKDYKNWNYEIGGSS